MYKRDALYPCHSSDCGVAVRVVVLLVNGRSFGPGCRLHAIIGALET